jgi:NAD(P)-dependent dehydrogenase (short-subunit alcohol dehydrogenase family)
LVLTDQAKQLLRGKVAIVTGASRGLGAHTALTLAAAGIRVGLVARSADALGAIVHQIQGAGGHAVAFAADLGDRGAIPALTSAIEHAVGTPTILVNAAGVFGPIQRIKDSDPEAWLQTFAVNTIAPYLLCRAFLNGMLAQGWGRIVNFSSAASLHTPGPLNSAYGTSKVALNQMTRHLASELIGTGVTANVIHPGDVKTEMWAYIRDEINGIAGPEAEAYQRWAAWVDETGGDDPQKAADLTLRLLTDEARAINGQFLWIESPLQAPIASWGEAPDQQPWRQ